VGVFVMLGCYLALWYSLSRTAWGKHVYAVGGNPEAARLTGIKVQRVVLSVYVATGLIAFVGAWAALGRIPNADPNAFQNANLESITAVVIGGTSLFGGRGGVLGTLVGTLIVGVLRNGLTLAGVDNLYQNIATGTLVILAVTVDQAIRRRSR
jgi:fructose transport system permease protein